MAQTATASQPQQNQALPPDEVIFGRSEPMVAIRHRVEKIIAATIPVLIQGESGSGKEVIARLIHQRSPLADGPLVKVNCPAIPGTLLESELFGYEKGAFTGAYGAKPGRVEAAQGGVLFLDEIGDLDLSLQAKLLQFLQDGQFCRLGGQDDTRVELRVICATNRPLEQDIANGTFRQDLFYRINVVNLQLPALRDRAVDIPDLAAYFLEFYDAKYGLKTKPISDQTLSLMQSYGWPGNVRELENLVKRYVILGSEETIIAELINHNQTTLVPKLVPNSPDGRISLKRVTREAVRELERQVILKALQANNWNRKRTAWALSISYRALMYKIRDAGLPPNRSDAR
ncbi:MAG: sigma-54 dependent transcriptional regulator [Acidobacteriia bacterium]|nr:sigma-54 dependent transcriptional regulator [Terriglobia bacterium]